MRGGGGGSAAQRAARTEAEGEGGLSTLIACGEAREAARRAPRILLPRPGRQPRAGLWELQLRAATPILQLPTLPPRSLSPPLRGRPRPGPAVAPPRCQPAMAGEASGAGEI